MEPEQVILEPSAVRSLTPAAEDEAEAGKTETEALESTRNWREDNLSLRLTREELVEPAGRENASTHLPASFPTKNKVHDTSGPGHHDSDGTNKGKVSWNGVRSKQVAENGGGGDQV